MEQKLVVVLVGFGVDGLGVVGGKKRDDERGREIMGGGSEGKREFSVLRAVVVGWLAVSFSFSFQLRVRWWLGCSFSLAVWVAKDEDRAKGWGVGK